MPLDTNALTSVANLEEVLGDIEDALAINLINRASDIIENYCDRSFKSATYTNEVYDGTGSKVLTLKQYPVSTFTQLDERNTDLNENSWTTIGSSNYQVDTDAGIIYLVDGSEFRDAIRVYRATYTAGYSTIPDDLEHASITLAVHLYNTRRGQEAKAESIGDYSITYGDVKTIRDLGLDLILDKYKKPVL